MKSIASTIESVLKFQVDEEASVREGDFSDMLSPFLRGAFDIYDVTAAGGRFCVARIEGDAFASVDAMKRAQVLERAVGLPVVLYFSRMTSSQRRNLIGNRRGFVSLQGDLYLPHMALFLPSVDSNSTVVLGDFTPAEQALFLFCLYYKGDVITQIAAMDALEFSSATVSRALSSLSERGFIDYRIGGVTGRLKEYFIEDKREFYRKGIALFGSPVSQSFVTSLSAYSEQLLFSGLSALSAFSGFTRPVPEVLAASKVEAKAVKDSEAWAAGGEPRYLIQVLKYDPRPLARMVWGRMSYVDPVTMLLTINDEDERISMAVREVMGEFEWYTE